MKDIFILLIINIIIIMVTHDFSFSIFFITSQSLLISFAHKGARNVLQTDQHCCWTRCNCHSILGQGKTIIRLLDVPIVACFTLALATRPEL